MDTIPGSVSPDDIIIADPGVDIPCHVAWVAHNVHVFIDGHGFIVTDEGTLH